MTLRERLSSLAVDTVPRCPAQRLLDSLPEDERASLVAALANPAISTLRIHGILQAEGLPIGRDNLSAHRLGRCYCPEQSA